MKTTFTFIFCFWSFILYGQCFYSYTFQGPPGNIKIDSIETIPNDLYRLDFSTLNVPDKLTVYNLKDSLEFTIGDFITKTDFNLDLYRGYCEFEFDKILIYKKIESDTIPFDFSATNVIKDRRGMMRLYYRIDEGQCNLKFKISGNLKDQTVYDFCITKMETGFIPVSDTIYEISCGPKPPRYFDEDCKKYLILTIDKSIVDKPIVEYNGCVDGEISVSFPNYPQYDTTGLRLGFNRITISNGVCEKNFDFYFSPSTLCEYYIPNAVQLESKENQTFMLYTKYDVEYELMIFDRWGGMIWEGMCISNVSGWKGVQYGTNTEVSLGVYTYVIKCLDQTMYGDVTVLK